MKIDSLIKNACISVVSSTLCCAALSAQSAERPNFIVILVDDMGWSDLGSYGGEINTPHLDRLAQQGMRFRQFYNTAKCYPSRACLLTGRYAQEVGMDKRAGKMSPSVTMGEALQLANYYTVAIGKHHGTENLYDRGFDRFYGLMGGASNHFNPGGSIDEGYANKGGRDGYAFDAKTIYPFVPEDKDFFTTDTYTDWALQLLDEKPQSKENFLLYLAYTAPHDPLQAWPEDIAKYEGVYETGYEAIREARWQKQQELGVVTDAYELSVATHKAWARLTPEEQADQARRMQVYAAMIDSLDQNIGRLMQWLEVNNYADNTVILFMSDNGSNPVDADNGHGEIGSATMWASLEQSWANVSNTPFRYYKNDSYEGGIRTPMIAWWPGHIEGGTFTNYSGHLIDVLPTLLDIANASYPAEYNGKLTPPPSGQSLLPAFKQELDKRNGPLYFQWAKGAAIIQNDWKAVKWRNDQWSLYNLADDPTEMHDVSGAHPEKMADMIQQWEQWYVQATERN